MLIVHQNFENFDCLKGIKIFWTRISRDNVVQTCATAALDGGTNFPLLYELSIEVGNLDNNDFESIR